MGTSHYTLGVDEWEEDGVRYARSFRDQLTLLDQDRKVLGGSESPYKNHFLNARGELVASYPNAEARYREGTRTSGSNGSFYLRVYLREDYPPPGWPPPTPKGGYEPGYDDSGCYYDC